MKQESNQTLYVMYAMSSFLFMVLLVQLLVERQKISFNLQTCSLVFGSHPVCAQPPFFGRVAVGSRGWIADYSITNIQQTMSKCSCHGRIHGRRWSKQTPGHGETKCQPIREVCSSLMQTGAAGGSQRRTLPRAGKKQSVKVGLHTKGDLPLRGLWV